jgi:hypothetical protein
MWINMAFYFIFEKKEYLKDIFLKKMSNGESLLQKKNIDTKYPTTLFTS